LLLARSIDNMESMTAQKLTYVSFADITKVERSEDGQSLKVFGKATDETLDGDGQKVDLEWAGKALKDWIGSGGNIRVQHNPALYPAGVGIELELKSDGAYVTADIVEPTAMRLVEKGALRAFSIGIANPKIVRDLTAPHGRINGGSIPELSIVDRPSNPSCGIKLQKGGDGLVAMDTWDSTPAVEDEPIEKGKKGNGDASTNPDDAADNDIPAGTGDSDSDDQSGDNGNSPKKGKKNKKNKVDNGDQLGKSSRREEHEGQEGGALSQGGHNENGLEAHGESGQHSLKASDDTSGASQDQRVQVEKLDLTGDTKPIITEVDKRERGSDGKFTTHSNPKNHDPSHHDSTDPGSVVGDDDYDGQAQHITPSGDTNVTAHAVEAARAQTHEAELPDAIPDAASPPAVQDSAATKAAKKAQKKIRKQAKLIKKLQKQARVTAAPAGADIPTIDKWHEMIAKNAKLEEERVTLTTKLEKISSQPTLGKAIRAPERVHVTKDAVTAEAQKRAVEAIKSEREVFLEGIATSGDAAQQEAARDMLFKMRNPDLLTK
jgi:hypothetical protein